MVKDPKVLVTGATGFVGRYLVDKLIEKNYEVAILVHKRLVPSNWMKDVEIFKIDITREEDFSIIPKHRKFEAVFHLATYIPPFEGLDQFDRCIKVNCIGTYNLLKFCQELKVSKIIGSSTVSVYGDTIFHVSKLKDKHPLRPLTVYGITKLMAELICEKYMKDSNMKIVLLRYSSVYGVGQNPSSVLPIFIDRAIGNHDIVIFGKGIKVQDFVNVKDVISANLCALKSDTQGIYNIGSGVATNIVDLAKAVVKVFNSSSKIVFEQNREEDVSQITMDISKAKRELGYKVNYILEDGLKDYYKILKRE